MASSACLDDNDLMALFENDGAAETSRQKTLQAHLDVCSDCRHLVAELARCLAEEGSLVASTADLPDDGQAEATDVRALWGGAIVGPYRLERFLGQGGLGIVWSATHVKQGGHFALKFLKTSEPARAKRFLREARVTAALRHPNIVHVHEAFEAQGLPPVIVMDLLRGESLRAPMRRLGTIPWNQTSLLLRPIVAALAAAHAHGVIHRDLKPENVFLTGDTVKVLDFGMAKLTAVEGGCAATAELTRSGHILGTPTYMAPEQLFGEKDIDVRADVWSLGVMAFECLSGQRPFEGRTLGHAIRAFASGRILQLADVAPHLPGPVTSLVTRMLSVERTQRPSLGEIDAVLTSS
ncbi:serine/threonine protein kinase [Pendulispora brunnea]|uniref:non-specific serine/threonine protein kinase n=1 Tax=Pendulispora brunnea TaxID=2905690 RepID=A0ABZ2KQW7_9BACT